MQKYWVLISLMLSASMSHALSLPISNSSFEMPTLQDGDSVSINTGGAFYQWTVEVQTCCIRTDPGMKIINPLESSAVLHGSNIGVLQPGTILRQDINASALSNFSSFIFSADLAFSESGPDWSVSYSYIQNGHYHWESIINPAEIDVGYEITPYEFEIDLRDGFSPDDGLITLSITNNASGRGNILIDNIAITAVPLPGAAWMFLTGIFTMVGSRVRLRS